ncbi:MAG TPA: hypothetical protein DD738_02065 [Ruminiclostridium sp.]|nr:hypothetical protein [Ruminiclostridium sp.]
MSADELKEKDKEKRGFSFTKLALFLFMVIFIAGVSMYAFMGINPIDLFADGISGFRNRVFTASSEQLSENIKKIASYDSSAKISCIDVSGDLAVADISSVRIYDSDGREKAYVPVNLKKPYIQAYQKEILIADLNGRYVSLISDGRLLWEKTLDEDLVNASLSENWILLITESSQSGYKRAIRAYSKDGQEIAFRNVSNYYPFDVFHFPKFNQALFVVNGIEASSIEANGFFEFLDPKMNQKASIRGQKEVFARGIPLEKERLFLYGEKSLIVIDSAINTVWSKEFTDSTLTAAGVIKGKFPVLAELNTEVLSRESRYETTIRILNADFTQKAQLIIDDKVTSICTMGETTAVQAGSEVYFINTSGEIMDRYTSKSDIKGVYLAAKDLAYIVSAGTIDRVQIQVTHKFLGIF